MTISAPAQGMIDIDHTSALSGVAGAAVLAAVFGLGALDKLEGTRHSASRCSLRSQCAIDLLCVATRVLGASDCERWISITIAPAARGEPREHALDQARRSLAGKSVSFDVHGAHAIEIHTVLTDNGIQFTNQIRHTYAFHHIFDRV